MKNILARLSRTLFGAADSTSESAITARLIPLEKAKALPPAAREVMDRIMTVLAYGEAMTGREGGEADEATYTLRETAERYVPDTLDAYFRLPPGMRDDEADTMLVEQLSAIERAASRRLARVALTDGKMALRANGAFLTERFAGENDMPTQISVELVSGQASAFEMAVGRAWLDMRSAESLKIAREAVHNLGAMLAQNFPQYVTITERNNDRISAFYVADKTSKENLPLGYGMDIGLHGVQCSEGHWFDTSNSYRPGVTIGVGIWLASVKKLISENIRREHEAARDLDEIFGTNAGLRHSKTVG
jgi:hypothetical protein